jgi:hypothetical protein
LGRIYSSPRDHQRDEPYQCPDKNVRNQFVEVGGALLLLGFGDIALKFWWKAARRESTRNVSGHFWSRDFPTIRQLGSGIVKNDYEESAENNPNHLEISEIGRSKRRE